ncbi:FadR/GntR family transcriptional regulator [Prescottella subtropica]|uniref:FadR/GntR family transcriptional regulator n=1 Tax=Prescottella subtropica TaxID=2545757 RepID=UPI0010F5C61D|nr:FCD domain-containing protein [Prescottella subtropica]
MIEPGLRRGPLVPQVEALFRGRIESGDWALGDRLPSETDLAVELGVGRSSVREAVRLLVRDGLLDVRHGVGTFVVEALDDATLERTLRRARLLEVLEVRRALEVEAARSAAERARPEDLADLRRQVAERHARRESGAEAFVTADLDFHRSVVALARNSVLTALFDTVRPILHSALVDMVVGEPHVPDTSHSHDVLVDALESGDGAAAVAATVANLDPMIASLHGGRRGT